MSLGSSDGIPAVMNVTPTGTAYSNGNCGGGWGGDWGAWIILFLIFGMFGWGGFGGFGGGFGGGNGAAFQGALTRGELCQDMNFQSLENATRGIQQGLCDGFYAVNTSLLNGFNSIGNAICNAEYQNAQLINGVNTNMMQGFNAANVVALQNQNAIQAQLSDCCCKNQTGQMQIQNAMERGFCQTNYNDATNTNAIIQNAHNDTDRILARLDAIESTRKDMKIAEQAAEIQAYKQNAVFGARIDAATAEILRRTGNDCPVNAYVVQPPQPVSFATNCSGQATFNNGYGYNSGCGCNSGCFGCNS